VHKHAVGREVIRCEQDTGPEKKYLDAVRHGPSSRPDASVTLSEQPYVYVMLPRNLTDFDSPPTTGPLRFVSAAAARNQGPPGVPNQAHPPGSAASKLDPSLSVLPHRALAGANSCSKAMAAAASPIIDADDAQGGVMRQGPRRTTRKKRDLVHRHHQPPGDRLRSTSPARHDRQPPNRFAG
jgi:hypothetical protein